MKASYPIILSKDLDGYTVYIPDFNINTEGDNLEDAIYMATDAIGLLGITYEDDEKTLPTPSDINAIAKNDKTDVVTLAVVDFAEYRRKNDMKSVKKNCTLPAWLSYEAEKAGINFSQVLQEALKQQLHV